MMRRDEESRSIYIGTVRMWNDWNLKTIKKRCKISNLLSKSCNSISRKGVELCLRYNSSLRNRNGRLHHPLV
ncbi:hypothetical protein HanRHA438_Chr07g0312491 [Helianthus annuus]|nr:hypothetical protein HanRHA438_Chr07g0312491 [Helianthus annuus]